jgi:AAA+ superfamily predicted ATPase
MSKNLHRDYAESVGHFCESAPRELGIRDSEVDAYFRACALCLWAVSGGGDVSAIGQLYTTVPARFTQQQYDKALGYYRANPNYNVGVPEFFQRLTAYDAQHKTTYSRTFAEVQKNLLMLCAAYDGAFTFAESQRVTTLYGLLTDQCDRDGVPTMTTTPGPEAYFPRTSPREVTDLADQFSKVLSRDKGRSLYGDFFGGADMRDPMEPLPVDETVAAQPTEPEQKPEEPRPTLEEAMAELNELVGLEAVKKDVESLVNLVKVREMRKERGLKCPDMSLHLVFSGNPGTGKTTVARIVGKLYCALGILSKGHLVEVDRSGLVAGYVGQTAIKTQEVIQSALGGVLFIDEAYALAPQNADKDFGQEAIDTILKAMEDHREDLVVIVAGYASLMPRFIDSNPGLKSRFNKYLYFEDYNGDQLYEIFKGRVERSDYCLTEDASQAVKEHLQELYEDRDDNFGNARDVRNLFEKIVSHQADRVAGLENPTDDDLRTITREDLAGLVDLPIEET